MKDIVNLINLTEQQNKTLLSIYQNCKTYKIRYKYPGQFQNELIWPETLKEWKWITKNILTHFTLKMDDIEHILYNEADAGTRENYIELPYKPSAINFVHFYPGDFVNYHNNKTFGMQQTAKINIPILNTSIALLKFKESGNFSRYISPILINTSNIHKVVGMGEKLLVDRVFFQILLKKHFGFYYKSLQWNSFQENH